MTRDQYLHDSKYRHYNLNNVHYTCVRVRRLQILSAGGRLKICTHKKNALICKKLDILFFSIKILA